MNSQPSIGQLQDGTTLDIRLEGKGVVVSVCGIPESCAEIAQQLAWLGSALRSSPLVTGVVYCIPSVEMRPLGNEAGDPSHQPHHSPVEFDIGFRFEHCEQQDGRRNGECWHGLFRNAVIVKGFPISRRPSSEGRSSGLELPLKMAAQLIDTKVIDKFGTAAFLKGFSTMAVFMRLRQGVCLWHLLYNESGDYIPYTARPMFPARVGLSTIRGLEDARQIVGWCPESDFNIGKNHSASHCFLSSNAAEHTCCRCPYCEVHD